MTYEITIPIVVKVTVSSEERKAALAAGVQREWLDQKDIDRGYDSLEYDVVYERALMGHTEVMDALNDWLDEQDHVDVVANASEVEAVEAE